MEEDQNKSECYFCKEVEINQCLLRSLYHKHNDIPDKLLSIIDQIVNKEKTVHYAKFNQVQYFEDRNQRMQQYYTINKSFIEQIDLLEYYKYRRYVPVFNRSAPTESIYFYYYEKLKIYYNNIKKKLNITVDPSQQSESNSLVSETQLISNKSKVLNDIHEGNIQKSQIKQYETQSRALENLVTLLKQNQSFKRVQSLKTEDCKNKRDIDPFQDSKQRKIIPQILMKKNKGGIFFRFIESEQKNGEEFQKIKRRNISSNENSHYKSKRNSIDFKQKLIQPKSVKKLLNTKSKKQISDKKNEVKSLPKVLMEFKVQNNRSMSTGSLKKGHILSSRRLIKKESEMISPYETIESRKKSSLTKKETQKEKKLKRQIIRTSKQGIQLDHQDNMINIRNKKIQMLKGRKNLKKSIVKEI